MYLIELLRLKGHITYVRLLASGEHATDVALVQTVSSGTPYNNQG